MFFINVFGTAVALHLNHIILVISIFIGKLFPYNLFSERNVK